jgi:hypothetical protein
MPGFKRLARVGVVAGGERAARPPGPYGRDSGAPSGQRNRAGAAARAEPVEPMPPTACRSVEPVPTCADTFSEPHHVHASTRLLFVSESGFGLARMVVYTNARGITVASRAGLVNGFVGR